jgi:hypothetical protein
MTVLSRGARVRRGGRRPGWVLLTALLVLAMGASSALVFTNRVELLKLAVILALWAAPSFRCSTGGKAMRTSPGCVT